ncbi:MAG: ABC-type transport auxiliary lipoprotein family protein [Rickettsiales bacterium]|nr:ABC-type transport auxiliary lipoprotein family protein [Rickettsiales bacterium]
MKACGAILFCVLLAACSVLTPRDIGNAHRIQLLPLNASHGRVTQAGSLIVALPTATEDLDTYRIALTTSSGLHDYFAGMRWSDFLTHMVQQTVIESLEQTHAFAHISSDAQPSRGATLLNLDIQAFGAEYCDDALPPRWRVRVKASYVSALDYKVKKEKIIETRVLAKANTREAVIEAAQQAFQQALLEMISL